MSEPLIFTDNAAAKVWELIQEENNFNLKLRVYVTGGGCSGFQYGFKFDEVIETGDTVIEKKIAGDAAIVQLLVDPISFQYLAGSKIDYQAEKDLEPAFIIHNPNAKTTCGCGSSFSA
ncbi:MAG: erpA 2 [Gammaproteobacteria bacterium]|jgi:iron-sulfur cluster insertion protein|nr:erpA 2 [Gammaproteobacteria bacterium]MCE3237459.1 erpA 2 [Gammaproteobacteria bacterium]